MMLCSTGPKLYDGISAHFGLNRVNPDDYDGNGGHLDGAVYDAKDMRVIAQYCGYAETKLFTDAQATRENYRTVWIDAAKALCPGDVFFITNSGHGTEVIGPGGDEDRDQALCLYDGLFLDDEVFALIQEFRPRVRIIMVADLCHSGDIIRGQRLVKTKRFFKPKRRSDYDHVQRLGKEKYDPACFVCLLSACQANQTALDGSRNGLFTETLLRVWAGGAFDGDYYKFHNQIVRQMPPEQTPNLMFLGPKNLEFFGWTKPFVVR